MAHVKNHDYHILNPSLWPFIGAVAAFVMLFGAVLFFHGNGPWLLLIGFVGVLIIIRPGGEGFNQFSVLALIAVGFITLRDAITRRLDPSVPSLFVALISAVPVLLFGGGMSVATGWTPMTSGMYGTITLAGIAITGGHLFAVMAMRNGEISFVAPFRYTGMSWAILFGFLLFGDLPDMTTIFGTFIVVGMGIYALHREQIHQVAATPKP